MSVASVENKKKHAHPNRCLWQSSVVEYQLPLEWRVQQATTIYNYLPMKYSNETSIVLVDWYFFYRIGVIFIQLWHTYYRFQREAAGNGCTRVHFAASAVRISSWMDDFCRTVASKMKVGLIEDLVWWSYELGFPFAKYANSVKKSGKKCKKTLSNFKPVPNQHLTSTPRSHFETSSPPVGHTLQCPDVSTPRPPTENPAEKWQKLSGNHLEIPWSSMFFVPNHWVCTAMDHWELPLVSKPEKRQDQPLHQTLSRIFGVSNDFITILAKLPFTLAKDNWPSRLYETQFLNQNIGSHHLARCHIVVECFVIRSYKSTGCFMAASCGHTRADKKLF